MNTSKLNRLFDYALVLTMIFFVVGSASAVNSLDFQTKLKQEPIIILPIYFVEASDQNNKLIPIGKKTLQLIKYLEKKLNIQLPTERYPFRRILQNAEQDKGIIFSFYKTPSRMQIFNYSEPLFADYIRLVTLCDNTFVFNKIQDLQGKTIGTTRDTSSGSEFDQAANVIFKAEYDNVSTVAKLNKLIAKRMDAFISYSVFDNHIDAQHVINQLYNNQQKTPSQKDLFCILPKPISKNINYFAIAKTADQTLFNKINEVLIQANKNKDLDRIYSSKNIPNTH